MSERMWRLTNVSKGRATVTGPDGEVLGSVQYKEDSYNLRRYFVHRYWIANVGDGDGLLPGQPLDGKVGRERIKFRTRTLAAEAVYDAARKG